MSQKDNLQQSKQQIRRLLKDGYQTFKSQWQHYHLEWQLYQLNANIEANSDNDTVIKYANKNDAVIEQNYYNGVDIKPVSDNEASRQQIHE